MTEDTYLIFHPTRLAFLKWHLLAIFVIAVGITVFFNVLPLPSAISSYNTYILIFFVVAGIFLILIAEILRRNDKYAITKFRIIEKSGIFNIKEDSIYWEKVSNYSLHQNIFQRVLKIGTIKLWSTGGDEEPEVVIKSAPQIKKIRFLLDKLIQKR